VALAAVKELVPPTQVAAAGAQNQVRYYATTTAGPSVAGALFSVARGLPFLFESLSYLGSVLLLLTIRRSRPGSGAPGSGAPGGQARGWRGITAGFSFIARKPIIRSMMFWIVGFNMAFTPTGAFLALIAVAKSRDASSSLIGMMISMAGLSGLLGAAVAGPLVKRVRPSAITATVALTAPACAALLALVPGVLPMGVILGLVYAMVPCINAIFFGYLAAMVPNALQGRLMGAVTFLSLIAQPIGVFCVGVIFDAAGAQPVFLTMAAMAAVAAVPMLTPRMLRLPRPEKVAVE
jgi:hypothetical protein